MSDPAALIEARKLLTTCERCSGRGTTLEVCPYCQDCESHAPKFCVPSKWVTCATCGGPGFGRRTTAALELLLAHARQEEREACAGIAEAVEREADEELAKPMTLYGSDYFRTLAEGRESAASRIAASIRSRGDKPKSMKETDEEEKKNP